MEYRQAALEVMKKYNGTDEKRINHALAVLGYTQEIIEGEKVIEPFTLEVAILTAIFHDIGIHEAELKYSSCAPIYQEKEGAIVSRKLLEELNVRRDILERVSYIVGHHHTLKAIDDIAFQIIWEADFLVNINEGWIKVEAKKINEIIEKNFKTKTGLKLIKEKLLEG